MSTNKMNDADKLIALRGLLEAGNGTFTVADLVKATGSPRRARRAIFIARRDGIVLHAIRHDGREVSAYSKIKPAEVPAVQKAPKKAKKEQGPAPVTTEESGRLPASV